MSDPTHKLSQQQKDLLRYLLTQTEKKEKELAGLPEDHPACVELRFWGVPWGTEGTRSEQAVLSRALARLEARGLLLRQCGSSTNGRSSTAEPPPPRTTSVTLTALGREIAKRLT